MDEAERIKLVSLIRETAAPLVVEPPQLPPEWDALYCAQPRLGPLNVKAVLFDVYGTLFCSAAGDISLAAKAPDSCLPMEDHPEEDNPLEDLARQYGLAGEELRSYFLEQVAAIHRARLAAHLAHTPWPEVRVEEIWANFLRQREGAVVEDNAGRELALRYELAVNPVYPMPGAAKTIAALREAGLILGIISNAQFFTPLLFEAFLGALPEKLGFDSGPVIWSFEQGEAKPSPRLFEAAAGQLEARGIAATECVFVGNDMLSDIYGAINAGFQGVLFAGDSRSLRLREGDERLRDLRPSRIIRRLEELTGECFHLVGR
jgi:putative hydrolase of the HAD superfamily